MKRSEIIKLINKERDRQDEKFGDINASLDHHGLRHVLGEEVGEIDKAFNEGHIAEHKINDRCYLPTHANERQYLTSEAHFDFMVSLRRELIHASAVIFQWLERFDWPDD